MIKITNKAIQTIAQSIYDETFKPLKEKQDKQIEEEKNKVKLTQEEKKTIATHVKALNEYNKLRRQYANEYRYRCSNSDTDIVDVELDLLEDKKSKFVSSYPKTAIPTVANIESVVIMATVDAKDMKDLVTAVKLKYEVK